MMSTWSVVVAILLILLGCTHGFSDISAQETSSNEVKVIEISEGTVYVIIGMLLLVLILNFFTLFYIECICGAQRPRQIHHYDDSNDTEKE